MSIILYGYEYEKKENRINVDKFDEYLKYGEEIEREVLEYIRIKYPLAEKRPGNHKEWDIRIPETGKTVEVKSDTRSDQTGNFFIECAMNDKPSGINATTSDIWIIVGENDYYIMDTEVLRYILRSQGVSPLTFTGKDGTRITGYLLRRSAVISYPYVAIKPRYRPIRHDDL